MRLIIQRVLEAGVKVDGEFISKIGPGMCILLGLQRTDTPELVDKWAEKALKLKLWPDLETQTQEEKDSNSPKGNGGWKTSVKDNNFDVLVVSNFTLYGVLKGNKPDFHCSMAADDARKLYDRFMARMQAAHTSGKVCGGMFQTYMNVHIVNDGPVTLCLDDEAKGEEDKKNGKDKHEASKPAALEEKTTEKKQPHQHEQQKQQQQQQQSAQEQQSQQPKKEISEEVRQQQLQKKAQKKAIAESKKSQQNSESKEGKENS